jgi:hypothetical protein
MPLINGPTQKIIQQDPEDNIDYIVDMSEVFAGAAIDSVTVTAEGVTATAVITTIDVEIPDHIVVPAGRAFVLWLTGGQVGVPGRVRLRVVSGVRVLNFSYGVVLKKR